MMKRLELQKERHLYLRCVCLPRSDHQPDHWADWGLLSPMIPQLNHLMKAPFLMEGESLGIFLCEKMIVSTAWQSEGAPTLASLLFVLESVPGASLLAGAELQLAATVLP